MPNLSVLEVHRSRTAFTSALAMITTPTAMWGPDVRRDEEFGLGSDEIASYKSEEDYWRDVKVELLLRMVQTSAMKKPIMVILTGDKVGGEFRSFLEEATADYMGTVPPIHSRDSIVVATKGAAELRRRGELRY